MESHAVGWGVVEAVLLAMDVVAVVVEARILRHLLAQVVHLVEQSGQRVAVLDVRLGSCPKGAFANFAIVAFEVGEELRGGSLLALPLDREGAVGLGPLGRQPSELALERHVLFSEKLDLVGKSLQRHLETGAHVIQLDEPGLELCALFVGWWIDLGSKPKLRLFRSRICRVARVVEVGEGGRLAQH